MSIFDEMLKDSESLFKESIVLDFDYMPKLIPFRENETKYMATCIKPLLNQRTGKNLIISGAPGIGKTVTVKNILREVEQESDGIITVYINCWKKDTAHKIVLEICDRIGYKFTHNKSTDELFKDILKILNKKSCVFVLDEIDKLNDFQILYLLLEEVYRKCIFLITNEKEWLISLDNRIRSRLIAESLEFKPYNFEETKGILKERIEEAFFPDVFDEKAFEIIVDKTFELEDIRSGLFLLKEAGENAELKSKRKIIEEHVNNAIERLDKFKIKNSLDLEGDNKLLLDLIKKNSGKNSGEMFEIYKKEGGNKTYRTFFRRIKELENKKLICLKEINKGFQGKSNIIRYGNKRLNEFT